MAVIEDRDERRHPLADWNPDNIKTWDEWLGEWNKTHRQAVREGLLHRGPNIPGWDINFYLEIADGHSESGPMFREPRSEARKELAKKAFSVLCQKVFKNTSPSYPSWYFLLDSEQLLENIFWFFGVEIHGGGADTSVGNLPDKPHEKEVVDKFLDGFLRLCCEWLYKPGLKHEILPKFRPHLLKLMWGLKKFDMLRLDWVTDEDMGILKGFALDCQITVQAPNYSWYRRKIITVEEACLAGSLAAETYLLLKIKQQVRGQLTAEAKRKADEEAFAREHPLEILV